ncbi:methyltransferase, TIGR04325 family [Chamaesiphon sp. VAR_48_metabat_403]|uniref:methyltransferase, TIGR04325 family n=1 Tax=Chamaesiphon sp. VAR_48_metabat_403 TaxID=2964700 RepID=UPI00286E66B1|nr:methyltransferase, TIGR04325 family [Chamaesiphon sp. VAR_48_metabat_403]
MKERLKNIPLLRQLYDRFTENSYRQKFETDGYGGFWGVFETFEEAIKAAPATKKIGYDCAELAQSYQTMLDRGDWEGSKSVVRSFDYPILYWMEKILQTNTFDSPGEKRLRQRLNIFDFGGNLGIHFLAYSKYLDLPNNLSWVVCDLPEIVKVGKLNNRDSRLNFTTDLELASGSDIFLASGSIQYDRDIAGRIEALERKPQHILINRIGLYAGKQIVTLQNGGKVFYAQYIFNRHKFINSFESIGYKLVDIWEDNVDSCYIPFHPEVNVPCYHGLYFKLTN